VFLLFWLKHDIYFDYILLAGYYIQLSEKKLIQLGYPAKQILNIEKKKTASQVFDILFQLFENSCIVYGLGNTRGFGMEIMEYLKEKGEKI